MTTQQFLEWSKSWKDGERYELVSGETVAMSPEKNRHNLVKLDIAIALRQAIQSAKLDCTVFGDGASVIVDESTVYEPDVTVTCGHEVDLDATTVPDPCLLVEVLSPSTQGVDTGGKLAGYFSIESVRQYLLVDPQKRQVIVHTRHAGEIGTKIVNQGKIGIASPTVSISIDEMFVSLD